MNIFGWWDELSKPKAPRLAPPLSAPVFDPLRKVAPLGLDEIDFDKRIAEWESLISASGEDEGEGAVNDN